MPLAFGNRGTWFLEPNSSTGSMFEASISRLTSFNRVGRDSSGFRFAVPCVGAGLLDRPVSARCLLHRGVPLWAPCTLLKHETTLHLRP